MTVGMQMQATPTPLAAPENVIAKDPAPADGFDKMAFLALARKRFDTAQTAETDDRLEAVEDIRFTAGDQWPDKIKQERTADDRPCLTINKLRQLIRLIVGDQRQNRISIKTKPVDSMGDVALANVYDGIIRNIEYQSQGPIIYSKAFEQALTGGFPGYFRILTEYAEDSFFQEIKIKHIPNNFSVYFDPSSTEIDYLDARFCFIEEVMSTEEFKDQYPDAYPSDFNSTTMGTTFEGWYEKEKVRVVEYYYRMPYTKKLALLADGRVIDMQGMTEQDIAMSGLQVVSVRDSKCHKIMWCKMTATEILEGPSFVPGKYIPVVPVPGDEIIVDGKRVRQSLIRHAKDAQRMYNYWRTANTEFVALAPKSPYLLTVEMLQGHESMWNDANRSNRPYLLYNASGAGAPTRQAPPMASPGMFSEITAADQEIKDTTGLYEASLGQKSNEVSGKAIIARQRRGDIGTFIFIDNLSRAVAQAGRIIVDLIPKIYDTQRAVRMMGEDGKTETVILNHRVQNPVTGEVHIFNDLSVGKFDLDIEVGPAYATQRIEAAESMANFIQYVPSIGPFIADLLAEAMDWPKSKEIAERLKMYLPPPMMVNQQGGNA